jgi:hypothetical protein
LGGGGGNALKLLTRLVRTGIVVVVDEDVDVEGAVVGVDVVATEVVGVTVAGPLGVFVSQATMRAARRSPATSSLRIALALSVRSILSGLTQPSYRVD